MRRGSRYVAQAGEQGYSQAWSHYWSALEFWPPLFPTWAGSPCLGNLEDPHSLEVTILMPNVVWTRAQHCSLQPITPRLKWSSSLKKGMITKRSDHLGVKVWIIAPGKPLIPAKVRAGVSGNLEWMIEEQDAFQLWPWDQTQQHSFLRLWLLQTFESRYSGARGYPKVAGVDHVGSLHNSSLLAPLFKAAPSPTDQSIICNYILRWQLLFQPAGSLAKGIQGAPYSSYNL